MYVHLLDSFGSCRLRLSGQFGELEATNPWGLSISPSIKHGNPYLHTIHCTSWSFLAWKIDGPTAYLSCIVFFVFFSFLGHEPKNPWSDAIFHTAFVWREAIVGVGSLEYLINELKSSKYDGMVVQSMCKVWRNAEKSLCYHQEVIPIIPLCNWSPWFSSCWHWKALKDLSPAEAMPAIKVTMR